MANGQIGVNLDFAAASLGTGPGNRSNFNGADVSAQAAHDDTDYTSIAGLRARLAVIDAAYYTTARLDIMTQNDMLYAVRRNDTPGTIRQ